MLIYGTMVLGYAALLAMLINGMRYASVARFLLASILVGLVWFTLCLEVLA